MIGASVSTASPLARRIEVAAKFGTLPGRLVAAAVAADKPAGSALTPEFVRNAVRSGRTTLDLALAHGVPEQFVYNALVASDGARS